MHKHKWNPSTIVLPQPPVPLYPKTMTKQVSDINSNTTNIPNKPYNPKNHHHHHHRTTSPYSPKLSIFLLATFVALFILFQIQSLQTSVHSSSSWSFIHHQWQHLVPTTQPFSTSCTQDQLTSTAVSTKEGNTREKLRRAVTFLPLKDLRYAQTAQQGHTWFMSSTLDSHDPGEVQFQQFPSPKSDGRLLCLKGGDTHDGAWNSYAFAWRETLPHNATLLKGLTFVSYNHYNYDNIWHGLSAMVPFVAWHIKSGCSKFPSRWALFHWGELRTRMGPWLKTLMEATFNGALEIERFDRWDDDVATCFEEAVVMRHNEGGMSRERRVEVYDLMRCKAREYCKLSEHRRRPEIGMTILMRTGPRSFKNQTAVAEVFERECRKVEGCRLMVAHSNNLTFCEQVKLMSLTDILVSPHGAQLTNMFFMDRNSSVMEFFPKGWLKLAGVGQYVFHWIASWSGMKHQGTWRDPDGDPCPYPEDDRRCMSIYKNGKIGYNETFFAEWARNVLNEVKVRKMEEASKKTTTSNGCACTVAEIN